MHANAKANKRARAARYSAINAAASASGPTVSRARFEMTGNRAATQASNGSGMNFDRNAPSVDLPMLAYWEAVEYKSQQGMRRKSQVRRKGHKFDRFDAIGQSKIGPTDDSIESVRPGDAATRRVSFSGLTGNASAADDLSQAWMPNRRNIKTHVKGDGSK